MAPTYLFIHFGVTCFQVGLIFELFPIMSILLNNQVQGNCFLWKWSFWKPMVSIAKIQGFHTLLTLANVESSFRCNKHFCSWWLSPSCPRGAPCLGHGTRFCNGFENTKVWGCNTIQKDSNEHKQTEGQINKRRKGQERDDTFGLKKQRDREKCWKRQGMGNKTGIVSHGDVTSYASHTVKLWPLMQTTLFHTRLAQ